MDKKPVLQYEQPNQEQKEEDNVFSPLLIKKRQVMEQSQSNMCQGTVKNVEIHERTQVKKNQELRNVGLGISEDSKNNQANICLQGNTSQNGQSHKYKRKQNLVASNTMEESQQFSVQLIELQQKKKNQNKFASLECLQLKPQRNQSAYNNSKRFVSQQS